MERDIMTTLQIMYRCKLLYVIVTNASVNEIFYKSPPSSIDFFNKYETNNDLLIIVTRDLDIYYFRTLEEIGTPSIYSQDMRESILLYAQRFFNEEE